MREASGERLSRLLSLVPWLERHDGVTIAEAATHFGITPQELERDLWLTVCCGLPGHGPDQLIDIQFWDEDGAISVIDAQTLDRPLKLRASEAMSLIVGLRILAQVPGDHDRAALASATAKLESASGLGAEGAVVVGDPAETAAAELLAALEAGRAVRIRYAGASRDEVTERVVEPGSLVSHGGRAYVAAWCREAGAQRTFRLDRMESIEVLDEPVSRHVGEAVVAPTVGETVRLRVAPRSRWLLETFDVHDRIDVSGGYQEASVVVAETDWLVRLVLGQGGGVEVVSPPGVRRHVAEAARRALSGLSAPSAEEG